MTGMVGRFGRIFLRYGCKTLLLLLAVSVIAFILVSPGKSWPGGDAVEGAGGGMGGEKPPPGGRYTTRVKGLGPGRLWSVSLISSPCFGDHWGAV